MYWTVIFVYWEIKAFKLKIFLQDYNQNKNQARSKEIKGNAKRRADKRKEPSDWTGSKQSSQKIDLRIGRQHSEFRKKSRNNHNTP